MKTKKLVIGLGSFLLLAFQAIPAAAQATRTWVSGVGDDVNPCSRTAPCKTFAGAISKTAAGGEINCLDSGGFGTVTITKSMTIDCKTTHGSILSSGGIQGVVVNGAGIKVTLRGISINGAGTTPGLNGIRYVQGKALHVENVKILGFSGSGSNGYGILVNPTAGSAELHVVDTEITGSGSVSAGGGIGILPAGPNTTIEATLVRVGLRENTQGLVTSATSGSLLRIEAVDLTAAGNTLDGIRSGTQAGALSSSVMLDRAFVVHNGTGAHASGAGARVMLNNSTIADNQIATGIDSGGQIFTYGNNRINANISVGQPPNAALPLQ